MARPEFVRFTELGPRHINRDMHIHTVATDGHATIPQIVARAHIAGLDEIALTEHIRKDSKFFPQFAADVRGARTPPSLRVYVGCEAKALNENGLLDISEDALPLADVVLGSVHRFPLGEARFAPASAFTLGEAVEREYALAHGLLLAAPIHVLAHPGGMCMRAFGTFPVTYLENLMRTSLDWGIAIEINSSYIRDMDAFLSLCEQVNPLVSIGSDAHRLEEVGGCRDALRVRGYACE